MELHNLDLNLLVVFNELLAERRVSKVAEKLGVSQPAVSNSLAKLRRLFDDEVFHRTPHGMEPTPCAEQLAESVGYALAMIHSGINQRTEFEPSSADRSFTVGITDIGEIYFMPPLIERLGREAPRVSLSTVRNTATTLRDDLESGKVDELLQRSGVERQVRLTVPHGVSVGHILQASDLVATVPERLADRLVQPFGLAKVPHPAKLPDVAINVFWHAKYHRAPANRWLRGIHFDLFADDTTSERAKH